MGRGAGACGRGAAPGVVSLRLTCGRGWPSVWARARLSGLTTHTTAWPPSSLRCQSRARRAHTQHAHSAYAQRIRTARSLRTRVPAHAQGTCASCGGGLSALLCARRYMHCSPVHARSTHHAGHVCPAQWTCVCAAHVHNTHGAAGWCALRAPGALRAPCDL